MPEANAVPVNVPAGATTTLVLIAVTSPLELAVIVGIDVDDPDAEVLVLTVAKIRLFVPVAIMPSPEITGLETTTLPVLGDIVIVPSEFDTEVTAPPPVETDSTYAAICAGVIATSGVAP